MSPKIDKHWAEPIIGKLLICDGDADSGKINDISGFKKLAGGDMIRVNPKSKTAYAYDAIGTVVQNFNDMPDMQDRHIGTVRKGQITPFENYIKNPDPSLEATVIQDELPGIFNFIKPAIRRLLEKKDAGLQNPSTPAETRRMWQMSENLIDDFIEDHQLAIEAGRDVRIDDLHAAYLAEYENDIPEARRTRKAVFSRKIKTAMNEKAGDVRVDTKRPRVGGKVVYYFTNLRDPAASADGTLDAGAAAAQPAGVIWSVGAGGAEPVAEPPQEAAAEAADGKKKDKKPPEAAASGLNTPGI